MDIALVMVKADGSSKEFRLDKEHAVVGRDEGCRLRIPLPSVSRRHCELKVDDDELIVKDLGSSNGTFVNGRKVKTTELAPGDLLSVGPVVFVVRIDGFPKDIDARECYAAGLVAGSSGPGGPDDEDDDDLSPPAGASTLSRSTPPAAPPAAPRPPTTPPPPPAGGKPGPVKAKNEDDDDDDLSALLRDLEVDDDEDDDAPKKK